MNLVFLFINMDTINTAIHTELATKIAKEYKYISIKGRYITINDIEKFLLKLTNSSRVSFKKIGESEENRNIYQIKTGKGKKKILIWTQMHGNESTGTKSVIDLINFLNTSESIIVDQILSCCTIKIIPILNPDGAEYFTRFNANKIDLNRDAVEKKAKESVDENKMPVSETLARIFELQGNIPKAIYVYEQLSLIFPKKKTYFASQINLLKKK